MCRKQVTAHQKNDALASSSVSSNHSDYDFFSEFFFYFFLNDFLRKNMIISKSHGDAKLLSQQMTFQQLSVIQGESIKNHKNLVILIRP